MAENHDNYLEYSAYNQAPESDGFARFEQDGLYYFSYIHDEIVILCSEGYQSESGREDGILSVQKNMDIEDHYKLIQTESGKWITSLKSANHREIARSVEVDSEIEARFILPSEREKRKQLQLAAMSSNLEYISTSDNDDYMLCREYEAYYDTAFMVDGIISFQHERTNKFYFAWYDENGHVILRSEGYPSASARDNGIEAVKKNRMNKGRYSSLEVKGVHFLILKAGNNKEIARSCPKKSAEEANALMSIPIAASPTVVMSTITEKEDTNESILKEELAVENISKTTANFNSPTLSEFQTSMDPPRDKEMEKKSGFAQWWWLLLLILFLLIAFLLWKSCNNSRISPEEVGIGGSDTAIVESGAENATANTPAPTTDSSATAAKASWAALGDLTEIKLPNGTILNVPENGEEKRLITFLAKDCPGDITSTWFNMDRVLFKTNSDELNPISMDQIDNIATIFKAFPTTHFKIGGYTDNVGADSTNTRLSADRAKIVMNALIQKGIASNRLHSKGYGPQYPVCPANNTEECRKKNRRVAIKIEKCN